MEDEFRQGYCSGVANSVEGRVRGINQYNS